MGPINMDQEQQVQNLKRMQTGTRKEGTEKKVPTTEESR